MGFLTQDQSKDGSWFGRWGVNYVYGTSGVLRALETVSMTAQDYCVRAVSWLRQVQKADGSFGESLNSYEVVSSKGQGNSTPSQTAWGLIGLLAGADPNDPAIARAATYLIEPATRKRFLERRGVYGNRLPWRVLPEVSPLQEFLPGVCACALPQSGAARGGILRSEVQSGRFPSAQRAVYGARAARLLSNQMRYPSAWFSIPRNIWWEEDCVANEDSR